MSVFSFISSSVTDIFYFVTPLPGTQFRLFWGPGQTHKNEKKLKKNFKKMWKRKKNKKTKKKQKKTKRGKKKAKRKNYVEVNSNSKRELLMTPSKTRMMDHVFFLSCGIGTQIVMVWEMTIFPWNLVLNHVCYSKHFVLHCRWIFFLI